MPLSKCDGAYGKYHTEVIGIKFEETGVEYVVPIKITPKMTCSRFGEKINA